MIQPWWVPFPVINLLLHFTIEKKNLTGLSCSHFGCSFSLSKNAKWNSWRDSIGKSGIMKLGIYKKNRVLLSIETPPLSLADELVLIIYSWWILEPEPGAIIMDEDSAPVVRVELALKCLPPYDPDRHWSNDSPGSFLYWTIGDYAHAYRSRHVTPLMVSHCACIICATVSLY